MSDSIAEASPSNGVPKVSRINEAVIRIAGNSQDGIQAIGGFLARLAGRSEQEVMTFMTIPATISGGPSIFQVRIGSGEVLSAGDEADVLLAFYQHSYEGHIGSLKKGGVVLYDSDHVQAKPEWEKDYHHVGIPITSLTVEAIGGTAKDKGKNIYSLGLVARIFDLNVPKLEQLISERFTGKNPSVLNTALMAFHAGHAYSLGNVLETFKFKESPGKDGHQVVMNGNEALGFGLIAAGVRFGAGYPITPWTDIMELLRRELPKYGGTFVQCEDEIASISMAIGGSYAGRVSVTGSSGPGISLKTEALGWAVMAEMPLVIVDVQRGGPSTGMPTNIEQSDLNIACFGGHGDSPRVVIAPANVEDCFYMAIEAVNIARKYSVPVIILTDQGIATRIEAFIEPDLEKLCQDISPDLTPVPDHKPYDLSAPDGVTHHVAPGTRILSGQYPIATGLEHDEAGPPDRLAKTAPVDDRQAPEEIAGARRGTAGAENLRPLGGQRPARRLGFHAGADPRSRGPSARRRRQRFRCPHQTHQPAAAGAGGNFLRFQPCSRRRDERRGALWLRPALRFAARALLRPENPGHQQVRGPHLEGQGNTRTRQDRRGRRIAQVVNLNRANVQMSN